MSKPKGRRRPLSSEIKSLRRPAKRAAEVVEFEPPAHEGAAGAEAEAAASGEVLLDLEEPALGAFDAPLDDPGSTDSGEDDSASSGDVRAAALANGHDTAADPEEADDIDVDGSHADLPPLAALDSDEPEDTEAFLSGLLEALLFTSQKPLPLKDLARSAGIDRPRAKELLERLIQSYRPRGVSIDEVAGGYVMRSSPRYAPYVQKLLALRPVRLSRAQLETLAIVAYRQPVTKPEVDDIRGVDTGQVIKGLLERNLLKILGKKDEPGRPMLYGTTNDFLELLNLQSLKDLPTLREYTELSEESRRKFSDEVGEEAPSASSFAPDGEGEPSADPERQPSVDTGDGAPEAGAERSEGEDSLDEAASETESEKASDLDGDAPSEPWLAAKAKDDEESEGEDESDDDDDDDDDESDDDDDDDESDDDDDDDEDESDDDDDDDDDDESDEDDR